MDDLVRDYARLALRLDRLMATHNPFFWLLDFRGPDRWRAQVAAEPEPAAADLRDAAADLAAALRERGGPRAAWLSEQLGALTTAARLLTGETLPLAAQVHGLLGLQVDWIDEEEFDEAHALLDRGLPRTPGSLRDRMAAWRAAHSIAPEDFARVPPLVERALAECERRTRALVDLPAGIEVDCAAAPGPFRGWHRGGTRGTVFVDADHPFNTADLLYVAAHEGFPGHIAEFMLKEHRHSDATELAVRVMPAPSYVVSEGLGLHAHRIAFPGDEAQEWLVDHVDGMRPDGSDFAAIHRGRDLLWGAWCNAAFLAADGAPPERVGDYLARWALLDDDQLGVAPNYLGPYLFAYHHGRRLLAPHVTDPARVRRLLTEPVTMSEIRAWDAPDRAAGGQGSGPAAIPAS